MSTTEAEVYRGLFPDWQTAIEVADQLTSPAYRERVASVGLPVEHPSDRAIVRRRELGDGYGWQVVGVKTS